jgi:hypothetical protein
VRNISFSITLQAFHEGTKDVTRRLGWRNLKTGDHLAAVEKAQGLKKGEKIVRIGEIQVVHTEPEPLNRIITMPYRQNPIWTGPLAPYHEKSEVGREGFPLMTPEQFVKMFCKFNGCDRHQIVNRIVFERVS